MPVITQCNACNTKVDKICIDHDHTTGRVRGVLCYNCNVALGHVKDSQERLQMLINYLNKSLEEVN